MTSERRIAVNTSARPPAVREPDLVRAARRRARTRASSTRSGADASRRTSTKPCQSPARAAPARSRPRRRRRGTRSSSTWRTIVFSVHVPGDPRRTSRPGEAAAGVASEYDRATPSARHDSRPRRLDRYAWPLEGLDVAAVVARPGGRGRRPRSAPAPPRARRSAAPTPATSGQYEHGERGAASLAHSDARRRPRPIR